MKHGDSLCALSVFTQRSHQLSSVIISVGVRVLTRKSTKYCIGFGWKISVPICIPLLPPQPQATVPHTP